MFSSYLTLLLPFTSLNIYHFASFSFLFFPSISIPYNYPLAFSILQSHKKNKRNSKHYSREKAQTMSFEDPKDFAASDALHLSNSMRISKNDTNLRWG